MGRYSTMKPVSSVERSVHARSICVGDTTVARSPAGAVGTTGIWQRDVYTYTRPALLPAAGAPTRKSGQPSRLMSRPAATAEPNSSL